MSFIAVGTSVVVAAASLTVGVMQNNAQNESNRIALSKAANDYRLKELNDAQTLALNEKVANAKTDTERLAIYSATLSQISSAGVTSAGSIYEQGALAIIEKQKLESLLSKQQNYITRSVVLAGGFLLVGGTIYILKK